MQLIRDIHSPRLPAQCALSIGNFDAMHIGHRRMLAALKTEAVAAGLPLAVMTFAPDPRAYFLGDAAGARLSNLSAKYFNLRECGVDVMLCLRFNRQLAQTSAEDFMQKFLRDKLNAKIILVGDDFRFGHARQGDARMLQTRARQFDWRATTFDAVALNRERVSSTRVREALAAGDLSAARQMLGRHYAMLGKVMRGQRRGREIGFPTLNLAVRHKPALGGVFAVTVSGLKDAPLAGVANLGKRPSVDGLRLLLEVHVFDFDEDAYARRVCVNFVHKIRDEKKFDSIEQLREQIAKDASEARRMLRDLT